MAEGTNTKNKHKTPAADTKAATKVIGAGGKPITPGTLLTAKTPVTPTTPVTPRTPTTPVTYRTPLTIRQPMEALTPAIASARLSHRVISREGLNLRSGPGTEFPVIRSLPFGTMVQVIRRDDPWALVGLTGDGAGDGHVHASYLVPESAPEEDKPGQ